MTGSANAAELMRFYWETIAQCVPPETVLVLVRSLAGETVPFSPRALEVTGVLGIGPREEEDGCTSMIRLMLDRPPDVPRARKQSQRSAEKGRP